MTAQASAHTGKVLLWEELTREDIRVLAPEALVVVPMGAIEQHGLFMPTGTDILLSTEAVRLGADIAAHELTTPVLIASFLRIGSSDHHLPFGGTISLPPATMLQVLTDAIRSMRHSGVRRVVIVNGHGGNTGVCHAAAAAITTTSDMAVAALDYFEFAGPPAQDIPVPGHAGAWETSMLSALRPDLVKPLLPRPPSSNGGEPGRGIYSAAIWKSINGYTDEPANASVEQGKKDWGLIGENLGARLAHLARIMK